MEPTYLAENPALLDALARVELLYSDVDGTLVARGGALLADGEGAPGLGAAAAIVEVNRAGLPVVLISGRSVAQLMEIARLVGWKDFIAETGAVRSYWRDNDRVNMFDAGEWPTDLPAAGRTVHDEILASGAYEVLREAFPRMLEHHEPWSANRDATLVLRGCVDVAAAQAVLDTLPIPLDFHDNGLVRRRSDALACEGSLHAYHVVPRGVSKRRAIELDMRERGLTPEQVAIIGDSPSDLAAAPACALAVLVGNALEQDGLATALATHPNAALVRGKRGDGWAEFARLWMTARGL
jgi:hydroxymethylpyrimidine pyrophosphatase-like HAD family hydrolase